MSWLNRTLIYANIFLFILLFWHIGGRGLEAPQTGYTYQDLITVLLTAIAVLLAAITLFVAGVAIWGYNAIRVGAEARAASAAEAVAEKVAADIARVVSAREAREAVSLLAKTEGDAQVEGDADDELAKALKGDAD